MRDTQPRTFDANRASSRRAGLDNLGRLVARAADPQCPPTVADSTGEPAVPVPRALEILDMEARMGALDARFLKVFIEARVYEHPEFLRLQNGGGRKAA